VPSLSDIEAALAEHFDEDHLAVYGDCLQQDGDPRGELIALDLRGSEDDERRGELARRWLGDELAESVLASGAINCGFLELRLAGEPGYELLNSLYAHRAGAYLRSVTIDGDILAVRTLLAHLAYRTQRWLDDVAIRCTGTRQNVVDDDLAERFVQACPLLRSLEVEGQYVFGSLRHRDLRSLRVTGHTAVGSLRGDGAVDLPALGLVDLAFATPLDDDFLPLSPGPMLLRDRFPMLRRLDLSRNEPGLQEPHYLGGRVDAFDFLAGLPVRDQLTHVRMPALRSSRQLAVFERAFVDLHALRDLTIVRTYRDAPWVPPRPRLTVREPYPWPPNDRARVIYFDIIARGRETVVTPFLEPLIEWLEQQWEHDLLSPEARRAWTELFDNLGFGSDTDLDGSHALFTALDSLEPVPALAEWIELRTQLRRREPTAIRVSPRWFA
jgi:hypothetical protein